MINKSLIVSSSTHNAAGLQFSLSEKPADTMPAGMIMGQSFSHSISNPTAQDLEDFAYGKSVTLTVTPESKSDAVTK